LAQVTDPQHQKANRQQNKQQQVGQGGGAREDSTFDSERIDRIATEMADRHMCSLQTGLLPF
jgi:hypothetical protein